MNLKTQILGIVGAAALSLALVAPTLAETATTTVAAGTMAVTATNATLTGATFSFTANSTASTTGTGGSAMVLTIKDDRGTKAGWQVQLQQTAAYAFVDVTGASTTSSLVGSTTTGFLSATAPTVTAATGNPGQGTTGITSSAATLSTTAQNVVVASLGNGAGYYDASTPLSVNVPAKTAAGNYNATVTASYVGTAP